MENLEFTLIDSFGEDTPNVDKCSKILELMKDAKGDERTARFKCVIAYIDASGEKHIFEGTCEGKISNEIRGKTDFCYDYIFMYGNQNKTFAEISLEEKNKVSHRKLAVDELVKFLKEKTIK